MIFDGATTKVVQLADFHQVVGPLLLKVTSSGDEARRQKRDEEKIAIWFPNSLGLLSCSLWLAHRKEIE